MGAPAAVNRTAPSTAVGSMNLWIGLGTLGSIGIAVLGTSIGAIPRPGPDRFWFHVTGGGYTPAHLGFYLSIALLVGAWVGVGFEAHRGRLSVVRCWVILALWGLPLFLGPPIFSRDLYSYIAQGLLAHHGLNPYHVAPSALGKGPLLDSIATVWRHTASPYGPLFVMVSRAAVSVSGGSLVAQILVFRAAELLGVGAIMVSLPRLSRRLGTDPGLALWLAALSPLALFSFIASGHNDALMVGLLVAGVTLATEGRLALGVALCALAALIKLPAAVAIVFLAVVQFQAAAAAERWRVVLKAVLVPCVVVVGGTLVAGYGWTWLGPTALHVPTELRVLATPAVSLGVFFHAIAHGIGDPGLAERRRVGHPGRLWGAGGGRHAVARLERPPARCGAGHRSGPSPHRDREPHAVAVVPHLGGHVAGRHDRPAVEGAGRGGRPGHAGGGGRGLPDAERAGLCRHGAAPPRRVRLAPLGPALADAWWWAMTPEAPAEESATGVMGGEDLPASGGVGTLRVSGPAPAGGAGRLGPAGAAVVPVLARRRLSGCPGRHPGGAPGR